MKISAKYNIIPLFQLFQQGRYVVRPCLHVVVQVYHDLSGDKMHGCQLGVRLAGILHQIYQLDERVFQPHLFQKGQRPRIRGTVVDQDYLEAVGVQTAAEHIADARKLLVENILGIVTGNNNGIFHGAPHFNRTKKACDMNKGARLMPGA